MATRQAALVWASVVASLLCGVAWAKPSVPVEYCSPVNTADMDPINSIYQSDGRCVGNCTTLKYALAIVQDKNCWCSNLIPNEADQQPLTDCEMSCPGYPDDYCGGDGVYGYMEVGGFSPTGTAPAGGTATKSPATTLSSSSSSKEPSLTTVTIGGTVRTVTATPDPTVANDPAVIENENSGLQAGAIVGIVVGVVGGLAVIGAFMWLWFFRRRRQNEESEKVGSPSRGGNSPGTMGTPRTAEVSENQFAGGIAGSASGPWDSQNKRRSHLMPVDPRLDPFATGMYSGENRSRESFNSLQDNQDYSRRVHQQPRVLRAVNPDPDDDDN